MPSGTTNSYPPRPEPPAAPPEGYVWAALPAEEWRIEAGRPCRYTVGPNHKSCAAPAVAALNRGRYYVKGGRRPSWWAYCADHMYGKWIEGGQVLHWCLQPEGESE